jgi:UDP-N-acetylglucosamine transferase subunit ALG13
MFVLRAFRGHDLFVVTHENARTQALPYRKYFLPNFSNKPYALSAYPTRILSILAKEKPSLVLSDGAEIAIPFLYFAKLIGCRVAFIETYTRINQPTVTGRLIYPMADLFLVFWPELLSRYGRKARFWGSLFNIVETRGDILSDREEMIFVTVGMHYVGFERLIRKMDDIAGRIPQRVVMQVGSSTYKPKNAEFFDFCDYERMRELMAKARIVVCQGAMSAIDALVLGTHVITVPRLVERGEVINNHQVEFARRLDSMGLAELIENVDDLESSILATLESDVQLKHMLEPNENFIARLKEFVDEVDCSTKF